MKKILANTVTGVNNKNLAGEGFTLPPSFLRQPSTPGNMCYRFPILALLCVSSTIGVAAQEFGSLQQDSRPTVAGLQVRAMGGAVGAVPMDETAFFYNPAHLARLDLSRPRITFVGVGAGVSSRILEEYRFVRDELNPAVEEGLEEIRENDYDRLVELYDRALELGSTQSTSKAMVYGPAVQMRISDNEAIGVGLFATNSFRMQFTDAGVGVPRLDVFDQVDIILPVNGAFGIPGSPLAVGATASYTRRYVTAKGALLEQLDADEEHLYVLNGSSVALDLGIHGQDIVPNVDVGAAFYRVVGGGFNYKYRSRIDLTGNDGPNDEAEIAALEERFNARQSKPTYRIGAAYRVPIPLRAQTVVNAVTFATDYVSASTSEYEQTAGAHFRMGIGAQLGGMFSLYSGYSQGYPSFGASVNLRFVDLEYAYFGIEDGRTAGQLGRFNHNIQIRFGLF